jgi:alpha-L-arabinofuranosidase
MKKKLKLLLLTAGLMLFAASCKGKGAEPDAQNSSSTPSPTPIPTEDYNYSLVINGSDSYDISDLLYGLFLEDINYAVDGGLYAEMIKNRSFEFGSLAKDANTHNWKAQEGVAFSVIDGSSDKSWLNENNPNYARVANSLELSAGISNCGFLDGMAITKDSVYNFSGYFKAPDGYAGAVTLQLRGTDGTVYGEATIPSVSKEWWKYEASLTASSTVSDGVSFYVMIGQGSVDMDMISLFPEDTYQGRKNGLRKDLTEALEELSPKFLRFPGGCVIEGETLENAYSWKDSIGDGLAFEINGEVTYGDVAARPLAEDLWGDQNTASDNPYYMTYGLGFYEYFLLCEDLGAIPVPILNAGMSCLIQGTRSVGTPAQTTEIGSPEFQQYVQDALDLVEFCKGDETTKWGAIRIAMGHKEPFPLTYIGIGNEQWSNEYYEHYQAFKDAFAQAAEENPELYGDILLIVANGPSATDQFAWNKIKLYGSDFAGLVDEHYYCTPSWFLTNTTRYDSYDRENTQVFLGEYAAKSNNMEAALAEAAYMTGLEHNGDIVKLASYAPLLCSATSYQWLPDMIYFQNDTLWKSANYYVQKLFSNNLSDKALTSTLTKTSVSESGSQLSGKIGAGTWMTSATFDNIKVVNNDTKEVLYSDDFSTDNSGNFYQTGGTWAVKDGVLVQTGIANPANTITGDALFFGDTGWTNYTVTMTATKLSGSEGFLIPFAVTDENNYYHWNIGGWTNTVSCLEQISGGVKSGQIAGTVTSCRVETGRAYELQIVVKDNSVECYLDGKALINYTLPKVEPVYEVSGLDSDGNLVVKIVNVSSLEQDILIQANDMVFSDTTAKVSLLAADNASDMNTASAPDMVTIKDSTLTVNNPFVYTAPKYSVTILKIPVEQ